MADIEKDSLSVKRLLAARGVSSELAKRIQEADADGNGEISIEELVVVLQSEQKAKQDVRLFRNIIILLAVSLIILIAATAGVTYGMFSPYNEKCKLVSRNLEMFWVWVIGPSNVDCRWISL
jgi:hypothetical protein